MSDTAYVTLLERELNRLGVIVDIDATDQNIHKDDSGWGHRRAWVTVARLNHSDAGKIETAYRSGDGITEPPSVAEVFSSLLSDSEAGAQTFEYFASEYGYDEDSRKAYAIWKECVATFEKFEGMFTTAELDQLGEMANEL